MFVRVRPPDPNLGSESTLGHTVCLDVTSDSTLTVYSKPDPKIFTFDHVAKTITQVGSLGMFSFCTRACDEPLIDIRVTLYYL